MVIVDFNILNFIKILLHLFFLQNFEYSCPFLSLTLLLGNEAFQVLQMSILT